MKRTRGIIRVLGLFIPVFFFLAPITQANVQEVVGLSPKAIGMGNAFTSIADDFSACYYNPAGLAQHTYHQFFLGYAFSQPRLKQYLLSKPHDPNTVEPVNFRAPIFGSTVDLTRIFDTRKHNVVLGVAATVGDNFKAGWRIHDWNPEIPRFILNGDDMNRAHVFSSIGVEVLKGVLYLGVGINLWENINVENLAVKLDLAGKVLSKEEYVNGRFDAAFIAGMLLKPLPWISFAYVYRGQMAQDDPTLMKAATVVGKLVIPIPPVFMPFRDYFLPWNMTGGISINPFDPLIVSMDMTFYHWSDFNLPMWEGIYNEWDDTIVPRLGIEYRIWQRLSLRTGYYYEESPVPDQSNIQSNYLDFNKHVLSAGIGYTFTELPLIGKLPFRYPVSLDAFFQYQIMEDRTQQKAASTMQEGWRIEGYQYALGFGVTAGF